MRLDVGYSARSAADLREAMRTVPLSALAVELHKLTVLHVDKDSELIAEVTGQSVERLAL